MWTTLAQILSVKKKKEKKKPEVRPRDGRVEHMCKFQGLSLKNGVDILTFFVRKNE